MRPFRLNRNEIINLDNVERIHLRIDDGFGHALQQDNWYQEVVFINGKTLALSSSSFENLKDELFPPNQVAKDIEFLFILGNWGTSAATASVERLKMWAVEQLK